MATSLTMRVVEAEARVYRGVWRGSVVSSFLNPVLFLLAMGVGLGSIVDNNMPSGIEGVDYLAFIAPGLLAATAMQTGASEGAWKVMAGIKWTKTYYARLATPIDIPGLVYGQVLWSAIRALTVSVVFAVVMAVFDVAPLGRALLAVGPAVLVGTAMAAMVTAFTARLDRIEGLPMMFRFVVLPMFLFSGAFFPISQLPDWIEPLAYVTPLYHGVELCRTVVINSAAGVASWVSVVYLSAWVVAGTVLSMTPFRKKLTP